MKRARPKYPEPDQASEAGLDTSKIMTLREVCEYLNSSVASVNRLINNHGMPAFRLGMAWRFRRDAIDRWIESRHSTPTEPEQRSRRAQKIT